MKWFSWSRFWSELESRMGLDINAEGMNWQIEYTIENIYPSDMYKVGFIFNATLNIDRFASLIVNCM